MIMNMSIEKMLSHVYEIEGLMLVTRRLGDENTPEVITNKIQRKVRELAEMCGVELKVEQAEAPTKETQAAETQNTQEITKEEEKQEAPEHLPEEDYDADETWQHDNGKEFKEVFSLDIEESKQETITPPADPIAPETPVTHPVAPVAAEVPATPPAAPVTVPEIPVTSPPFREEINEEPVPEPDPEILPEDDRELEDITVEFIMPDDEEVPEPEEEMPMPPVPTEFPEVDEPQAPMRVDEKLQRTLSKDIRKAFSVNDRFRFQRELFAGSANAMNTAIEHIEIMRSYGNAELYFYSQLNWDRENEVVQDFMNIVRNHFQG